MIKMSPIGVRWLSVLEGTRLNAYQDENEVWTIGTGMTYYPETREPVREGDILPSRAESNRLLALILSEFEEHVSDLIAPNNKLIRNGGPFPEHITDPLISFCFNIGKEGFRTSTALKRFNSNFSFKSIAEAMGWWKNPNLTSRRQAEARCLLLGIYTDQFGRLTN